MRRILFPVFVLALFLSACQSSPVRHSFTLATYNLRNSNRGDSLAGNGWGQRLEHIASLIQFHEFAIFGTQEGKYHQLEELKAALPGFEYIGAGRTDGVHGGEHAAIFFDAGKFELLDHGDFWLSQTPEVAGSLGWDAMYPRVCTWGKFRVRDDGFTFIYYNLHMDHVGVQARSESARLILRKVQENPEKLPAILSGDFNISQENEAFKLLDSSGTMSDAWRVARLRYINSSTFNNYNPNVLWDFQRIDHIFLTGDFQVRKYGVLNDNYRGLKTQREKEILSQLSEEEAENDYIVRNPSDHYPVMAVLEY